MPTVDFLRINTLSKFYDQALGGGFLTADWTLGGSRPHRGFRLSWHFISMPFLVEAITEKFCF